MSNSFWIIRQASPPMFFTGGPPLEWGSSERHAFPFPSFELARAQVNLLMNREPRLGLLEIIRKTKSPLPSLSFEIFAGEGIEP